MTGTDSREWTADQLTELIATAIRTRDLEAVPHLITLLALKDPHQAKIIHEGIITLLALLNADTS